MQYTEIVDDYYGLSDQDADSDTSEKVECLDLRYTENAIKTPFPFKDANGNFTKVIKELREKFGASLCGRPRIELKVPK